MELIFFLIVILVSAIMHEYAHGWVANQLGDPTAKLAGRLTLNPIPHIDPMGTILLPGFLLLVGSPFLFGWAKPVPYNPYNLRNQRWGPALVGAAGPGINFLIALIFALVIRFVPGLSTNLIIFFGIIVFGNLILGIFNLIPVPPLDGSKVLFSVLPQSWYQAKFFLERYGFVILLMLIVFGRSILSFLITFAFIFAIGFTHAALILGAF